jgi:hypothetical protein
VFPPAELLLALLLLSPAAGRYPEYARQAAELERTREACAALEAEMERTGGEIERLERAGKAGQARALLRESHDRMEALTDCRRRQKAQERTVRDLGLQVRRETETELDRVLAAGLPRREAYERIRPLLEVFHDLPAPGGCPIADFEEVEFTPEDPSAVLKEKRLLVDDVLRRLALQEEADAARLRELRSEHDLRRQLSQFMTGLAVEGGAGVFDMRPSEDENQRRLRALEEEAAQCERARKVGDTQLQHWTGKAAELDRLLAGAGPPL